MDEILASIRRIISENPERQTTVDTQSSKNHDPFAQTTSPDQLIVSERAPPTRSDQQIGSQECSDDEVLELAPTMQATDATEQSRTGISGGLWRDSSLSAGNAKNFAMSTESVERHGQNATQQDPRWTSIRKPVSPSGDAGAGRSTMPAASVDVPREAVPVDHAVPNSATATVTGLDEVTKDSVSWQPQELSGVVSSAMRQRPCENDQVVSEQGYRAQGVDSVENEIGVENDSRSPKAPTDPWPASPPLEGDTRSEIANHALTEDEVLTAEDCVQDVNSPKAIKSAAVTSPATAQSMEAKAELLVQNELGGTEPGDDIEPQEPELAAETSAAEGPDPGLDSEAPKAVERDSSSSVDGTNVERGASVNNNAASPPQQNCGEAVRSLEDTVAEMLKPMLQEWLDANMPKIVEKAIQGELRQLVSDNNERTNST